MTSATPKPRAGEHTFDIPKHMERNRLDAYDALLAERDLLRERERELVEALRSCVHALQPLVDDETSEGRTGTAGNAHARARAALTKHGR